MENTPFTTGALTSQVDYRDGIAAAGVRLVSGMKLPETFQSQLPAPLMQAKEPACVAHSAVENLRVYWFIKTGKWVPFSARFLDIMAKRFDGQDRVIGGTYPRLVFKIMATYGCCTEDVLPNDTTLPVLQYRDDSVITPEILANAVQHKTPGYVGIGTDMESTREAIYLYGITSALFEVGSELWTPSWNDADIDPLRTPAQILSGHQMSPHGWKDAIHNVLRNSWSDAWANKGDAAYEADRWQPFIREQWAIAEIPQDVANYLQSLPAPQNFHYRWDNNLAYGQRSDDVKFLQVALMILGFLGSVEPTDLGIYGPQTAAAVGAYQRASKIQPAPNNVGPLTRSALNTQFAI